MCLLLCEEANYLVVCHTVFLLVDHWNGLNEADHSFVALGVKFAVITGLYRLEPTISFSLWQSGELWLDRVFKVGKKPDAILKFDLKRLVIDGRPGSSHVLLCACHSVFAKYGLYLELIHQFDLPDIFLGK